MKKFMLFFLSAILILSLSGCQKEKPEPIGPLETLDLTQYFPSSTGFSWFYEGAYEYQAYETLIIIEQDVASGSKHFIIEGARVDMSGGEAGDMNYTLKYGVSKDQIIDASGISEILLLRNPIQIGQRWETPFFDQELGDYTAVAEIVTFNEGLITVKYSPKEGSGLPKDLQETRTFEKDKGITQVSKKLCLNIQSDTLTDFNYALSKTFTNKPKELLLKHYSDNPLVAKLYKQSSRTYDTLENTEVQWQYIHRKESVDGLYLHYSQWLETLDREDIHSLILAKSALSRITVDRKDGDGFVRAYMTFANDIINASLFDLSMLYDLDYDIFDDMVSWDDLTNQYALLPVTETSKSEVKLLRPLLKDAGLLVTFNEGYAYTILDGKHIIDSVRFNVSEAYGSYLDLLKFDYEKAPVYYEGNLVIGKDIYLEHIIQLDLWAKANKDMPEVAAIQENQSWSINMFLVPNYFYEDASFVGGFMSQAYIQVLEQALAKHKEDTPILKLIKEALVKLSASDYLLTEDYLKWISTQGILYGDGLSDQDKEAAIQLQELKGLYSPYTASGRQQAFEVSTVDELISAIGSDRKIILKSGALLLPYYGGASTDYAAVTEGILTIKNVSNLVIEGSGKTPSTLLSQNVGMAVRFDNVKQLTLNNMRIGHSLDYCTEASLDLKNCVDVVIANTIIFGCGEWGINIDGTQTVTILNSLISDCNTYAAKIMNSTGISFMNSIITRNGKNLFYLEDSNAILFDNTQLINNVNDTYTTDPALFALKNTVDITLKDSVVKGNAIKKLSPNEGEILNNNSYVE
jgi:hypothetical protein